VTSDPRNSNAPRHSSTSSSADHGEKHVPLMRDVEAQSAARSRWAGTLYGPEEACAQGLLEQSSVPAASTRRPDSRRFFSTRSRTRPLPSQAEAARLAGLAASCIAIASTGGMSFVKGC